MVTTRAQQRAEAGKRRSDILAFLMNHYEFDFSKSDISKNVDGLSYGMMGYALEQLLRDGEIVITRRVGTSGFSSPFYQLPSWLTNTRRQVRDKLYGNNMAEIELNVDPKGKPRLGMEDVHPA